MDEINGRKWKEKTFDKYGISYPRTAKGNPSFSAGKSGWMAKHEHWLPQLIAIAKQIRRRRAPSFSKDISSTTSSADAFTPRSIRSASDDGGTRSSRFSYSDPPLQQMPSRDKELGPLIRSVFLPEEGEIWAKPDISQQEFRFVVHYAVKHGLPVRAEAAETYRNNPDADFHAMVAEMTGLDRDMREEPSISPRSTAPA